MRNLIRRFVEVGVPGYHIEDQRPGTKKCGHQGGKVLVAADEQIKRLNAARFQLDIMGVPGIIVARTDAEAATLLDGRGDERDQPFILGATNVDLPTYKAGYLAAHAALPRRRRRRAQRPPAVRASPTSEYARPPTAGSSATGSRRWSPRAPRPDEAARPPARRRVRHASPRASSRPGRRRPA